MFKSYIKIALRNHRKNKGYTAINIAGMGVGLGIVILIGLWIYDELSFNKYHQNYDRVTQVLQNQSLENGVTTMGSMPYPLVTVLRTKYAGDLKHVAAFIPINQYLAHKDKVITRGGAFADPDFAEMATLQMLSGTRSSLQDPSALLLSRSLATAIFGQEDPINKEVKLSDRFTQKVTGVYEDIPANSRFANMNFLAPMSPIVNDGKGFINNNWQSYSFQVYAELTEHADANAVSSHIKNVLYDNTKDASKPELFLYKMKDWYLFEFKDGKLTPGRLQFVWMFGIIGIIVLVLACINFMNLNTARSEKRAKEVGIRKTIGSLRSQLISQFFIESFLIVFLSFLLAIITTTIALPWFNELSDKQLKMPLNNLNFWLFSIGFIVVTVLFSGSYPAFYLSSFKPARVLKGTFRLGKTAAIPRKLLVVVQFTVSVALIIATIIVYQQIQFAKNRPIGYNRDHLLAIDMNNPEIFKAGTAFKNDLLNGGIVDKVSSSSSSTTRIFSSANNLDWKGKNPNKQAQFGTILIDPEYGDVVQWKILEGRNFSNKFATDSFGFIFNESAIKLMDLKNPVGENVKWHGKNWHIIGVVKDMVMESPFDEHAPTVFMMNNKERSFNIINVKLKAAVPAGTSLAKIREVYKKHCPSSPFEYKFADTEYGLKFAAEERIGELASVFATLAIFISCLGLFGLATFIAEKRTREIGVRKVLGASVFTLWKLLSKDFVVLIIISCLVAIPVSYYFMHEWLQNYRYRVEISWWIFVAATAGALGITLMTISFQAIKAALMNPVKSLRTE